MLSCFMREVDQVNLNKRNVTNPFLFTPCNFHNYGTLIVHGKREIYISSIWIRKVFALRRENIKISHQICRTCLNRLIMLSRNKAGHSVDSWGIPQVYYYAVVVRWIIVFCHGLLCFVKSFCILLLDLMCRRYNAFEREEKYR